MLHKAFYYILILFAVALSVTARKHMPAAQPQAHVMMLEDSITDIDIMADTLDIENDTLDMVMDTLDIEGGIIYVEDSICGVTTDNDTIRHGDVVNDNKALYRYTFQTAMAKFIAGDMELASFLLGECTSIDPEAAEAYFYLAKCYGTNPEDSVYQELITKAAQLDPGNSTYTEALIPVYLMKNELDKAASAIEELVSITPERTDMLNVLLKIYEHTGDKQKSLETLDRLEMQDGQSSATTMAKIHIYDSMGEEKKALDELRKLADSHPLELDYRTILGNWLFGKGRYKEAQKEYTAVLAEDPDNESAMISMIDYYQHEGQDSLAKDLHNRILSSPKTQTETKAFMLRQAIRASEQSNGDTTEILAKFDLALQHKQTTTDLLDLKLAYMDLKKMSEQKQIEVLNQIIEVDPANMAARNKLIYIISMREDTKEVIRLAQQSIQFHPDKLIFRYYLAMAYYTENRDEECANLLKESMIISYEEDEAAIAENMYQILGDVSHQLGRNADAYAAYDKCLAINPDNAGCLNNYAYYLSEENRDLDKAEAMSLKTVKENPNNPTYLDTYAWILYLQGRYEEANIYIEMAVKNLNPEEDNTVILDHQKSIQEKLK